MSESDKMAAAALGIEESELPDIPQDAEICLLKFNKLHQDDKIKTLCAIVYSLVTDEKYNLDDILSHAKMSVERVENILRKVKN